MSTNPDHHDGSNMASPQGRRKYHWAANQSAMLPDPPPPPPSPPPSYQNATISAPPPLLYRAATIEEQQRAVRNYIEITTARNAELAAAFGLYHPAPQAADPPAHNTSLTDDATGRDEGGRSLRLRNRATRSDRSDAPQPGNVPPPPPLPQRPDTLPTPTISGLVYRNLALAKENLELRREIRRLESDVATLVAAKARLREELRPYRRWNRAQREMRRQMQQVQAQAQAGREESNAPLQHRARVAAVQERAAAGASEEGEGEQA